ncbi:MAG: hypothetical protein JOS17DRAFT_756277, partial [Linnemannia elongata]
SALTQLLSLKESIRLPSTNLTPALIHFSFSITTFTFMDQRTPSEKVLSTLELTQLIADELSQHDLALCCLVNKTFNTTFIPHLWHSITILQNDLVPKFQSPEGRAALLRNGHHIRVLRAFGPIALEPFVEFGTTCTNLVSLDVQHKSLIPIASLSPLNRSYAPRSSAMRSRGRRGSAGTGQRQRPASRFGFPVPPHTSAFGEATQSSGFGFGSVSSTSGFGASDHTPTSAFGGATNSSALGFGELAPIPASSGPLGTSYVSNATNLFSGGGFATDPWAMATAKRNRDAEAVLVGILKRNPRLEFLVVPSYCMESEAVIKLAGESLLLLKEFYSQDNLWARGYAAEFCLYEPCDSNWNNSELKVRGFLRQPGGARSVSLLKNYPRLTTLQLDIAARINDEELRKIRNTDTGLTCVDIYCGDAGRQACRQILMEASGLTSIRVVLGWREVKVPFDDMDRASFLKHAPTLEHLYVRDVDFDDDTALALLRACPLLKTLRATGEPRRYRPGIDAELDAPKVIISPWACNMLEIFDCKISRVPRPDIVVTEVGDGFHDWVSNPPSQVLPHSIALQESRDLQRKVLKQLGRLTRLRTLSLSTFGSDVNDVPYSQLEIKGIRTMIVDPFFQT